MSAGVDANLSPRPALPDAAPAARNFFWRTAGPNLVTPAFVLLTVLGAIVSIRYGPVQLSFSEVVSALLGGGTDTAAVIVLQLRLPRVLVAMLVGLNLSLSGLLMQAVLRNPLAEPQITGVSSGAALAATIVLIFGGGMTWVLPLAAFAGALAAAALVQALAWRPGESAAPLRIILAGVAVASMLGALTTSLMIYFSDRVQPVLLWLSGNLIGAGWKHLPLILPYSLVALIGAFLLTRQLDILQLGDDSAATLGVRVRRLRIGALVLSALAAASAVCVAGLVGFAGLIVPHIARLLAGPRHAVRIPAVAAGGAALLVWADLLARNLNELPVGILTAALGGPFFIHLLRGKQLS